MGNTAFDPLRPTPEQYRDLVSGYRSGLSGWSKPQITSEAFDHGYTVGRNDKDGIVDDFQLELIGRLRRHD